MSVSENRYGNHFTQRLPRRKRTISLPGDLEDNGKFFKCWNCGFVCNADRNRTGDGDGKTQTDTPLIAEGGFHTGDRMNIAIILDDMFTVLQNGQDGNPITDYRHNNYPQIIGGCPLCGSLNYR